MSLLHLALAALCGVAAVSGAPPLLNGEYQIQPIVEKVAGASCFPALDFVKPATLPKDNTKWWCDASTEYAFVGFSYEVTACEYFGLSGS